MISISTAERIEDLPELLVPAIIIARVPSTRKLMRPADILLMVWYLMNKGSVHGLSRWRRKEKARPEGSRGWVIVDTRAVAMGSSISRSEERRVGKECRSRWS